MYGLRREGPVQAVCCPPSRATLIHRSASQPRKRPVNVPSTALAPARTARREAIHQESLELNTFADAAAPKTPRRRVLTHEEEVDLSQRIEAGERDALHALLGTVHAAAPLRALAGELREGRVMPSQLVRNAEEDA